MLLSEKLREILDPKDLATFEASLETMIKESASAESASIIAEKEKEIEAKWSLYAEEFAEEKSKAIVLEVKTQLIADYDKKLSLLESKVKAGLSTFVDKVIAENVDNSLLERIAINEVAVPVLEGIRNVYKTAGITLTEGVNVSASEDVARAKKLEKQVSELISKNIALESKIDATGVLLLISEHTEGMTETQKEKVARQFKGSTLAEAQGKISDFVKMLREMSDKVSDRLKTVKKPKIVTESIRDAKASLSVAEADDILAGAANLLG